jgi:hypothetical protein
MIAITPDKIGQMIQVLSIFVKTTLSVGLFEKKFHPIIAPTIAWDVETGKPARVIENTASAADNAVMKAPGKAEIAPNFPSVWVVPAPEITAPRTTNNEQMIAADRQLSILVPTAVPNTFAASFAPSAQPKNKPLDRNKRTRGSNSISFVF